MYSAGRAGAAHALRKPRSPVGVLLEELREDSIALPQREPAVRTAASSRW